MADLGPCRLLTKEIFRTNLLESLSYVLTDCDGVLWADNAAIPGSPEALAGFRKLGKKVMYVTNNSTKSRIEYMEKCKKLHFQADMDEFFSTSYCTALYLKKLNFEGNIYLVGSHGLRQELTDAGFNCSPIGPDPVPDDWMNWAVNNMKLDPQVKAVVVGFDAHFNLTKMLRAASYLANKDCLFVGTNTDEQFPCGNKSIIIPGTGCIVQAVATAASRKPIIVGKPEPFMPDCIKYRWPDLDPAKTIMIGDRSNTDILMGKRAGMKTLLVGSGCDSLDAVRRNVAENRLDMVPDFFVPKLGDVVEMMPFTYCTGQNKQNGYAPDKCRLFRLFNCFLLGVLVCLHFLQHQTWRLACGFSCQKKKKVMAVTEVGSCRLMTTELARKLFLGTIKYVLTDCDGVLWTDHVAIPGSIEAIALLRKLGKKIRFVTNNSTSSRSQYIEKCKRLHMEAKPEEFFNTSYCTMLYLKKIHFKGNIYLIGNTGLYAELTAAGFKCTEPGPDPIPPHWREWTVQEMKLDPEVKAVVVGFDEHFSMTKIIRGASYLRRKDCLFVCTNSDEQHPCGSASVVVPETGCIVQAMATVSGRTPTVLGKPEPFIAECIRYQCPDLDPSRTVMIGDRMNTDILMGKRAGLTTILVGTGIENLESIRHNVQDGKKDLIPDYYLPKLGDLLDMLK
ncbi:uncharacterized protein LOC135395180 [Ornithodoros turicata]